MKRILLFFFLSASLNASNINIITYNNGVGLGKDIDLLSEELGKLGHNVQYVHYLDFEARPKADINIFIEMVSEFLFESADKNYLIPNPEWYVADPLLIPQFDKILCKTREAERIFKSLNPNTTYMSFTCEDKYDETVTKDYKSPIHIAGKSVQKGTDTVVNVWKKNPDFPKLILLKHMWKAVQELSNLKPVYRYLSESDLLLLQNYCGVHICPSETEGFGHYIFEALSCGAVVVTTDGPPMNEFIKDPRCLVGASRRSRSKFATNYHVDEIKFAKTIEALLELPEEELREIGRKNREYYLENDRFFKQRLADLFGRG